MSVRGADWAPRDLWLTRCARGLFRGGVGGDVGGYWIGLVRDSMTGEGGRI